MKRKTTSRPIKKLASQGLVEFALVLPILLLVVIGLMEVGRMMFIYSAANTAARQAVRYGAATGSISSADPTPRYQDCAGIRAAAKQAGFGLVNIQDADITIAYDTGPSTSIYHYCNGTKDTGITLQGNNVSRINVTVIVHYQPMVTYTPLTARDIRSEAARTILNNLTISVQMGTPQLTLFPTLIITPTSTATATETATITPTSTATPTLQYTFTPSRTPTITPTPTITNTPTVTPTFSAMCDVNYNILNDWDNGNGTRKFQASVTVKNLGTPISGWNLNWAFPGDQTITAVYSALGSQSGQSVTITNQSYNADIPPDRTFEFQATYTGTNNKPSGFNLNGMPCTGGAAQPTPTISVCDLRDNGLKTGPFGSTIFNYGSANVNITRIKITANTSGGQKIQQVLLAGSQLWGGNSSSVLTIDSPFTGNASIGASIPPNPTSKLLQVQFKDPYEPNGAEQIEVSFDACPTLVITP
jgi:Flp pilus assembly protein TadG